MLEKKQLRKKEETAILVGLIYGSVSESLAKEYIEELAFLATTSELNTRHIFLQKLPQPDKKTFIGSGKLLEIAAYLEENKTDIVIFDDELSVGQINQISKVLKVKVIDRPMLILDIFAQRARSAQAKVQVELAQYQYLLPRLKGLWRHLERQGGGVGTRGPGETEIETDRRMVQNKISFLKKKLQTIARQADTQRKERTKFVRVSLVGYTNVGKSSLMNLLSKETLPAENKLFATLDTTTRKVVLDHTPFLLSDTVGFIRKLPHHLIESFKSTLEEVKESDILLHVADIAHPMYDTQIATVQKTLQDIGINHKQQILALNKTDAYKQIHFDAWTPDELQENLLQKLLQQQKDRYRLPTLLLSARASYNLSALKEMLLGMVKAVYQAKYPYQTQYFY